MNKLVMIELKDICYYYDDFDDFEYEPFIVEKSDNFEEKYEKLVEICNNYDDFQDIEDFICENFKKIDFEKRVIEI